jgi:hypothetical protein
LLTERHAVGTGLAFTWLWFKETLYSETLMNTQISLKLTAFAVAVMMNTVLLVGVAHLFNAQIDHHGSANSSARVQMVHVA